jgi:hypothetical protein
MPLLRESGQVSDCEEINGRGGRQRKEMREARENRREQTGEDNRLEETSMQYAPPRSDVEMMRSAIPCTERSWPKFRKVVEFDKNVCVPRLCVSCACMRVCVHVCICVCAGGWGCMHVWRIGEG